MPEQPQLPSPQEPPPNNFIRPYERLYPSNPELARVNFAAIALTGIGFAVGTLNEAPDIAVVNTIADTSRNFGGLLSFGLTATYVISYALRRRDRRFLR